jgi:hypothetical protein
MDEHEVRLVDVVERAWRHSPAADEDEWWNRFALWPPNVFAIASLLLRHAGAYTRVVSPGDGPSPELPWPPTAWATDAEDTGRSWLKAWWEQGSLPQRLLDSIQQLRANPDRRLSELRTDPTLWRNIFTLHAAADEACAGFGLGTTAHHGVAWADANNRASERLQESGTMADISPSIIAVVPKMRTPQCGISLHSLSLHLAAVESEVRVRWLTLPATRGTSAERRLNLLLLPWPLAVSSHDFHPSSATSLGNLDDRRFGLFDYEPLDGFPVLRLRETLESACAQPGGVDGVVLPEGALSEQDIRKVQKALREADVPLLVAGVRRSEPRRNAALLSVHVPHEAQWSNEWQYKHHRWCLDRPQIESYALGDVLHPSTQWWENMPRQQNSWVIGGSGRPPRL